MASRLRADLFLNLVGHSRSRVTLWKNVRCWPRINLGKSRSETNWNNLWLRLGSFLIRYPVGRSGRAPTYDWQWTQCQYRFRQSVQNAAADLPIITCLKC